MTFAEVLKQYMTDIPCSAAELSAVSGLAPSMISRYLRAEQTPGEKALRKLSAGLDFLFRDKGKESPGNTGIFHTLQESLSGITIDYDHFIKNLQRLLNGLNINKNELAKSLSFDPSYISRILSGSRKPANVFQFLSNVSDYIANRFFENRYLPVIADILECDVSELSSRETLSYTIKRFLGSHADPTADILSRFLLKIDTVRPAEHPALSKKNTTAYYPAHMPHHTYYRGISGMMQADLDFLSATLASRNMDDVIFYNDMPPIDEDNARLFNDSILSGLRQLVHKGLMIQVIYDVHRPFGELLSMLESTLPLYLTGHVQTYYLPEPTNHTFTHCIRAGGSACINGDAVFGNPGGGRFVFSRMPDDVMYTKERAAELLSRAHPLMEIYTRENHTEFTRERIRLFSSAGDCHMIRTAPPIFTMSERLLDSVIKRNELTKAEADAIRSDHKKTNAFLDGILKVNHLIIDIPEKKENDPVFLSLPGLFFERKIAYTKAEYDQHIADIQNYALRNPSVELRFGREHSFKNLEVMIFKGNAVLLSKCSAPEAHFIVLYPRMVRTLEELAL